MIRGRYYLEDGLVGNIVGNNSSHLGFPGTLTQWMGLKGQKGQKGQTILRFRRLVHTELAQVHSDLVPRYARHIHIFCKETIRNYMVTTGYSVIFRKSALRFTIKPISILLGGRDVDTIHFTTKTEVWFTPNWSKTELHFRVKEIGIFSAKEEWKLLCFS